MFSETLLVLLACYIYRRYIFVCPPCLIIILIVIDIHAPNAKHYDIQQTDGCASCCWSAAGSDGFVLIICTTTAVGAYAANMAISSATLMMVDCSALLWLMASSSSSHSVLMSLFNAPTRNLG